MLKLLNYPAMASPESLSLIEREISQFIPPPGPILDPYCGTGRMLFTLRNNGYDVVGVDCSPIAILAARVAHQRISCRRLSRDFAVLTNQLSAKNSRFDVGRDESFWFRSESFVALRNILRTSELVASSTSVRRVFWLALVKVVREVSYIRENEYKLHRMSPSMRSEHRPNVHVSFLDHCGRLIDLLTAIDHWPGRYRLLRGDVATASLRRNHYSALVTSPPYGDSASTVGYGQFSRVPLLLLRHSGRFCDEYGPFEDTSLDGQCLGGSSCAYSRATVPLSSHIPKNMSPAMARYTAGYFSRLALISQLLKQNAICCLALGNRTHRGQTFPLIETTIEFLENLGFLLFDRHDRLLARKRLPRSMRHRSGGGRSAEHDSINYESVVTMIRQ